VCVCVSSHELTSAGLPPLRPLLARRYRALDALRAYLIANIEDVSAFIATKP
jgi:hypothetical protein